MPRGRRRLPPVCEREIAGSEMLILFNPGSPTERRRAPARSMGIAELRDGVASMRHVVLE
jgi:predicted phosphodiesterase